MPLKPRHKAVKLHHYVCPSCVVEKRRTLEFFTKQTSKRDGLSSHCRSCIYKRNEDRRRKYRYGLSPEDHKELLEKQSGLCAICGRKPDKIHVDHCHSSGVVRGLLCANCNLGLGAFKDTVSLLNTAANYLSSREPAA